MAIYLLIGAIVGVASVGVTRCVYGIEDLFDKLPIHWMWWPAIGAIPVGIIGHFQPQTLGVGYENISNILMSHLAHLGPSPSLCTLKFISWAIALGSGTSGGTLAPLFTIGSGLGLLLGSGGQALCSQRRRRSSHRRPRRHGRHVRRSFSRSPRLRRLRLRNHPPTARLASRSSADAPPHISSPAS